MDWLQDLAVACGTRLDPMSPSAGGNIPGFPARWHALFPPVARNGPVLSIRRSRLGSLRLDDFGIPDGLRMELDAHLQAGGSVLVSGPTGSGKSSFLGAMLCASLRERRMVIIESVAELSGLSPAFLELVARPPNLAGDGEVGVGWLFQESLRLRPDGIVIGEIRGDEAAAFCSAMSSGHPWCLATIHAGSPREALDRLASLAGRKFQAVWDSLAVVQLGRTSASAFVPAVVGYGRGTGLQYNQSL